jgi:hypothetical protein
MPLKSGLSMTIRELEDGLLGLLASSEVSDALRLTSCPSPNPTSHAHALRVDAIDHHPGAVGAIGLRRSALLSGCRLRRISPVSSLFGGVMLASSLRLDVLAARITGCRNSRHLPSRSIRASASRNHRVRSSRRCAARSKVAPFHTLATPL